MRPSLGALLAARAYVQAVVAAEKGRVAALTPPSPVIHKEEEEEEEVVVTRS
jgi:hypothetical protein